ncbi:hypothetical protein [Desulfobacter postgatei]|uniref:Uncharacterized protein n=1 Tax=Desulfobacter postgatei 2ac9 TaxID=879212 RepID=I5B170_9BACT|nr:hypothetical protein [Desulfobacter postgatei]EIM63233.1 hypothetical protein DespoDRAFT_01273 [Desulfobacter postgatei 2ac9]
MTSGFFKLDQVFFIWVLIKYGYYKSIVKLKLSKIKHTKNMFFSKTFMFFEHQVCFILSKLNEMIDPGIEREESVQINIKDRICPNNRNGMLTHKYNKRDLSTNTNMMLCPEFDYVSTRPIPTGKTAFRSKAQGMPPKNSRYRPINQYQSINRTNG